MATFQYNVEMTCEGCSNAINRILTKKLDSDEKFEVDLPNRKVTVTTTKHTQEEVLEMLKKSGKAVHVAN